MVCERCGKDHDGSYGSGRFCSKSCAKSRSFSKESREKKSKKVKQFYDNLTEGERQAYYEKYRENAKSIAREQRLMGAKKGAAIAAQHNRELAEQRIENYLRQGGQGKLKDFGIGVNNFRRYILDKLGHVCSECGIGEEWNGKPLTLHVDHIDGNYLNNGEDNLRVLCPNCHTQTDTYGAKNRGKGTRELSRNHVVHR